MTEDTRELPPPKDAVDLYPEGEWLKYQHLRGTEPTLTIASVGRRENLQRVKNQETGKYEERWKIEPYVIWEQTDRMKRARIPCKSSLNVTLRKSLEAMFGESDIQKNWCGKRVTLTTGRDFRPDIGKIGPCVRIKGSPDISEPVSFSIKKKQGAPVVHTMVPTKVQEKK